MEKKQGPYSRTHQLISFKTNRIFQTHRLHISIQQPTLSLTDSLSFPLKIKDGADMNKVHNDTQAKR